MADVYENGYLTIAATAARDSSDGCFSDADSPFRARKLNDSVLHVAQAHEQYEWVPNGWTCRNYGNWPLFDRA